MKLRDRIKELRRVKASDILPNPANWRTHPKAQQDAMRGILAEVGIADALLVRETPAGLQLIDGHLRADVAPDSEWPVLVLDVDDKEAAKLLATVDPLAAMAETDPEKLQELLRQIDVDSEALQQMLAELADEAGLQDDGAEIVEDEVPAPPDEATTQLGDLWILGNHRLLCGDSSKPDELDRLLDGATIHLVNTDPPYNVKVEPRSNNAIAAGLSSFAGPKHHQSPSAHAQGLHGQPRMVLLRLARRRCAPAVGPDQCSRRVDREEGQPAINGSPYREADRASGPRDALLIPPR
jgi:hypothetical protein